MTKSKVRTSPQKKNKNQVIQEQYDYALEIAITEGETPAHSTKRFDKSKGFGKKSKQSEEKTQLISSKGNNKRNTWETGIIGAILSFAFFLVSSTILIFGMNFVHRRMPLDVPPLPDLGHELIPKLEPENLGDYTVIALVVSMFVALLFNSNRFAILIRFFNTMGVLYLLRLVSNLVTSLPPTENHCRYNYLLIENIYLNTLKGLYTLGGNIHCGDLMFSAHTCMATAVWMVFMTNYKKWLVKFVPTLVLILTVYFIIATRSHYTVDVWIAFCLTVLVYKASPSRFPFTAKRICRCLNICC